jgi:hypothetical protein
MSRSQPDASINGRNETVTGTATEASYVYFASLKAPELVDLPYMSHTTREQRQPEEFSKEDEKKDKNKDGFKGG